MMIDQEQKSADMVAVMLEGCVQFAEHDCLVAWGVSLGQAVVQVRIVGQLLESLLEFFGCECKVMLLEGQVSAGKEDLTRFRIGFARIGKDGIEDDLRIHAPQEESLAKGDKAGGIIAVSPGARSAALDDVVDELVGGFGLPVAQKDFSGDPAQAQTAGLFGQCVRYRGAGIRIFSGGKQGLGQQDAPFNFLWLSLQDLLGLDNAIG